MNDGKKFFSELCEYFDTDSEELLSLKNDKFIGEAEKLLNKIITIDPYSENIDIHFMKLQIIEKKIAKNILTKTEWQGEVKECLDNLQFSYFLNKSKINLDKILEFLYDWFFEKIVNSEFLNEKDSGRYVRLIEDIIDASIARGDYLYPSDTHHPGWLCERLVEIYERYGKANKDIMLKYAIYSGFHFLTLAQEDYPGEESEGEYEVAKSSFEEALDIDPHNALANYGIARVYLGSEELCDDNKARFFLEKAVENKADGWEPYFLLGELYVKKFDEYEKAEEIFNRLLNIYKERDVMVIIDNIKKMLGCFRTDERITGELRLVGNCDFSVITHFLGKKNKKIKEKALEPLCKIFGEYWEILDKRTQDELVLGEMAFTAILRDEKKSEMSKKFFIHYYDAMMLEIYSKIFNSFKNKIRFDVGYRSDMEKIEKSNKLFFRTLKDPGYVPTLKQICGIIRNCNKLSRENSIYENLVEEIKLKAPVLNNRDYLNKLISISEVRNEDAHKGVQFSDEIDYDEIRNIVLGDKEEGTLLTFARSVETAKTESHE